MSEAGAKERTRRALRLALVIAVVLAGLALWRGRWGSGARTGTEAETGAGPLSFPICTDPVAVVWPGSGERLGCLDALPELRQVGAEGAGCLLGEAEAEEPRPKAGERLRFRVGEGGACLLSVEMLPGSALLALGLPIDLNRARAEDLEVLEAIGPTRARAVIAEREARGPFESVQALTRVSGIGPKTLEAVRAQVTVAKSRGEREDAPEGGTAPDTRGPGAEDPKPVRGTTR